MSLSLVEESCRCRPLEKWIREATSKPTLFHKHTLQLESTVESFDIENPDIDLDLLVDLDVIDSVIRESGFDNIRIEELTPILELNNHLILSRTFESTDNVKFIVFCGKSGASKFVFEWPLDFFWSNFGFDRPGGFFVASPRTISFICHATATRRHVLMLGPTIKDPPLPAFTPQDHPTCKILSTVDWQLKDLMLSYGAVRGWPFAATCNPDPSVHEQATVLFTSQPAFRLKYSYNEAYVNSDHMVLLQLDLATSRVTASFQDPAYMATALTYSDSGRIIIVVTTPLAGLRLNSSLWIFRTERLQPLRLVKILDGVTRAPSLWSVMGFMAPSYEQLHVVLWQYDVYTETASSNVMSLTWSPTDELLSLKRTCRKVIASRVPAYCLCLLPLPPRLIQYLKGYGT